MAYDEGLAQRARELLDDNPAFHEKRMFGGIAFLLSGNMCCGVVREQLIVRVGPDAWQECLARRGASEFDITGRSMRGWVMIDEEGYEDDADMAAWVGRGVAFAETLPPK